MNLIKDMEHGISLGFLATVDVEDEMNLFEVSHIRDIIGTEFYSSEKFFIHDLLFERFVKV